MRKREAIQPRKIIHTEADVFPITAGSNAKTIVRVIAVSVGVRERGEYAMVVHVYLGGLTVSGEYSGKDKRSFVNGVSLKDSQKSDCLIVVMKRMKVRGAKGATNQRFSNEKHVEHWRFKRTWNRNKRK